MSGLLNWTPDPTAARRQAEELIEREEVGGRVEFTGVFAQADAPELYARADILLHTKYNDPCPSTVIEALACGVPVVYSASGGVPELVGSSAGIGVSAPLSWDEDVAPEPEALASAVIAVANQPADYARAARSRAVGRLDLKPWIAAQEQALQQLLSPAPVRTRRHKER